MINYVTCCWIFKIDEHLDLTVWFSTVGLIGDTGIVTFFVSSFSALSLPMSFSLWLFSSSHERQSVSLALILDFEPHYLFWLKDHRKEIRASLIAQLIKNPPATQETQFSSWVGKIYWRRERLPTPVFWPGEFCGLYSLWGCKESDTTEQPALSMPSEIRIFSFVLPFFLTIRRAWSS